MIRNLFSFGRNQGVVLATLLLVIAIGAAYFFAYVPNNQRALEEKQFRGLQNTETNITNKIDNSLALLRNLVNNYEQPAAGYSREKLIRYINSYPTKNFTLSINTGYRRPDTRPAATGDTTVSFNEKGFSIQIRGASSCIGITYTIQQFLGPLLSRDIFDQYIVLSQSNVIYQSFPSGITQLVADSLKNEKSAFAAGQVKDITLGGTTYKLFSQQMDLHAATKMTIAGLLTKDHYGEEKNKLPEQAALLLLLLAIAAILALPWIKLYQMGGKDRMTSADGLFSLGVPMLLMSILFYAFCSYNLSFRQGTPATPAMTKNIADSIKKKFDAEISRTYLAVVQAASAFRELRNAPVPAKASATIPLQTRMVELLKDMNVNQVYQLDSKGTEIQNWTAGMESPPAGDYSNREYFLHLKEGRPFYLKQDKQKPFCLEQVVSWITGSFTTVLAIPGATKADPYTAISFTPKTLDRAILTPGMLYCIIDERGKVLYHSDPARQLTENLFSEFSANGTLKASIEAHSDHLFTTKYSGRQYDAYVSPFSDLPYSVVILEDRSYDSLRAVNNFMFSFCMLFSFFIVLGTELLIVFIVSIRKHYYKKHYFDLSWIGPNEKFRQVYHVASWGNLASILWLLCWIGRCSFLESLFMLLTASSLSFLFLNLLYARTYKKIDTEQYKLKTNAVIALGMIIIILNIVAALLTETGHLLIFQVILCLVLALLAVVYENRILKQPPGEAKPGDYSQSFSIMTFTRLVITSGLPVFLFYISIANYEIKLITRYRQTKFIQAVYESFSLKQDSLKKAPLYVDSTWIKKYINLKVKPDFAGGSGDACTGMLFRQFTTSNTELVPGVSEFEHAPADGTWLYSSLFQAGRGYACYHLPDKSYIEVESAFLKYSLPAISFDKKWYKGWSYWILFFSALAGFWFLLHHILRRLFALNLPSGVYWEKIDELLLKDPALNPLVFLIGSPGSGKLSKLRDLIKAGSIQGIEKTPIVFDRNNAAGINYYIADMILIPNDTDIAGGGQDWETMRKEAVDPKYKLIIVNHFEYDIKNPASNRLKLNFLEDLLQKNTAKIFIISTVHPINFLDSLNQQQANEASGKDHAPEHDLERWHVLLGHFKIAIEKLDVKDTDLAMDTTDWEKTLCYETGSSHFLNRMREPIDKRLKETDIDETQIDAEALTLKLGITAHYFYMYMWQSLTKEEKFLLYDLAEDGLVNPFDDYNLILLISKGLVIREGGILKLFNQGFRNFILTAIGSSEALQIQQQIRDNGNWNKLKTPLIILIIAVLAFLFTSQKETYTTLIKYLTVISLGVPMVMKVFSLVNSSESKSA